MNKRRFDTVQIFPVHRDQLWLPRNTAYVEKFSTPVDESVLLNVLPAIAFKQLYERHPTSSDAAGLADSSLLVRSMQPGTGYLLVPLREEPRASTPVQPPKLAINDSAYNLDATIDVLLKNRLLGRRTAQEKDAALIGAEYHA